MADNPSPQKAPQKKAMPYLKIVLIGDQGVGKTALLDSFEYKKISKTQKPTIGADFMKKKIELPDKTEVNLQLWDTAGQERFQSLCTSFYRGADCCVIVYDVGSEDSYLNLQKWRNNFSNATNVEGVPFVILGNKSDTTSRVHASRVQKEWLDANKCNLHFNTSALTNHNVDEAFQNIARLALEFQIRNSAQQDPSVAPQDARFSKGGNLTLKN